MARDPSSEGYIGVMYGLHTGNTGIMENTTETNSYITTRLEELGLLVWAV